MRGFILAAGFGTRLKPITDFIPKALVPVCGKPLLARSLEFLATQGITTIGVNMHYLPEQIQSFRERSAIPFSVFHEKERIRGTGGGIYFARSFLEDDELFLVINVDIIHQFDMRSQIERFMQTGWAGGLFAVRSAGDGTIFYDEKSGLYRGVPAEKNSGASCTAAAFIGAAVYRRKMLDLLTEKDFSIVPVWKRAMEQGHEIGVLIADKCAWLDVGTPVALAKAHFDAIDCTTALDIPAHLRLEREQKRCFHRDLPVELRQCMGSYSWVETARVPKECHITRSVVYENATLKPGAAIENMICTPHCEVSIGS